MTPSRRLFWKLNAAGWLGYGLATYVTYAPVLAGMTAERRDAMLVFKVMRMALGFALSLGLHRACRHLRSGRLPLWGQALLLFLACWLLGGVWWLLLRAASAPLRPAWHQKQPSASTA
ncbi:hypothetical protein [Corallococcus sp. AS-1-12]|uniref:hypothetical protein n=1 Tax=Corallococcus sp. AS-1-12 TaxID=2874598 RepID=UPI001CBA9375|nr:hypothetical protein [Corallococcus sp. AS-1-12]MBZ4336087.1 hypothetical protein [Corallococcus sp. AS-1-12]